MSDCFCNLHMTGVAYHYNVHWRLLFLKLQLAFVFVRFLLLVSLYCAFVLSIIWRIKLNLKLLYKCGFSVHAYYPTSCRRICCGAFPGDIDTRRHTRPARSTCCHVNQTILDHPRRPVLHHTRAVRRRNDSFVLLFACHSHARRRRKLTVPDQRFENSLLFVFTKFQLDPRHWIVQMKEK